MSRLETPGELTRLFPGPAEERLAEVVAMMREMSRQTDPQEMVRAYSQRVRNLVPSDGFLALSRRGLEPPWVRITRSSRWSEEINPWTQTDRLPVLKGGLLSDLIYEGEPQIINDLEVDPDDPAAEYLQGSRSLMALANYDQGQAMNMSIRLSDQPGAFDPETFPEQVWLSNLFGQATHNLVLSAEVKKAYRIVERELRVVAEIQRSLLPKEVPPIRNFGLATHYQTSQWAGGDYYDFFPLPDDQWGILIADVSGHGTPAAVMMAITHSIAHGYPGHPSPPAELLGHVNDRLSALYTTSGDTFVTAFYGVYDPSRRRLTYASAGHNPPRLKRCVDGTVASLDAVGGLPLGLFEGTRYDQAAIDLVPHDQIVFYTDGITESTDPAGEQFGLARLDQAIENCSLTADGLMSAILDALEAFTAGMPAEDDRTVLVGKVT